MVYLGLNKEVQIVSGVTDLRKSINGLSALLEKEHEVDPLEGGMYAFCNRNKNRLKILKWTRNGFWLCLNRLEQGHYKWADDKNKGLISLSCKDFEMLVESPGLVQKLHSKELFCDKGK